ncbi:hypothetical protein BaRGS_00038468, partial [Batillaria attramentaria]
MIARRLDYMLVSDSVIDRAVACNIYSHAQSDHRRVEMRFKTSKLNRGPSYWKFNDSLLQDRLFVQEMNSLLEEITEQTHSDDPSVQWDL